MPHPAHLESPWTVRRIALALGALAFLAVLMTLADPGITVDEPLDVRPGRAYVAGLRKQGLRAFERGAVDRTYRDNAEHPPLGRWLLGLASTLGEPFEVLGMGGADPTGTYVLAGRLAPAVAFAILVGLVAAAAGRRHGPAGAVGAGLALMFMPRAFAHAHLGALDTLLCLFWTLALLRVDRALVSTRPGSAMVGAGLAWGLALLTKIHAWLLPPIVLAFALARLRPAKAVGACAAWGVAGLAVFAAGWPWLWYDSRVRWLAFLATGLERTPIRVLYFGRVYLDREVPWHYPWFYFAATVPVGLQLLGTWGLIRGWRDRRADPLPVVLAGSIAVFLVLFSTRTPVYDGERLFLVAFPLWAILIGGGFAALWRRAGSRPGRKLLAAGFLLAQGYGVAATHPFGLSYYNAAVGGLPGAERLGLELTYWGDAVDGPLLATLAEVARPGETAALAPSLAPGQGAYASTRALWRRGLVLRDQEAVNAAEWVAVYRREAYWSPGLRAALRGAEPVAERSRQGVWLARLYRLPPKIDGLGLNRPGRTVQSFQNGLNVPEHPGDGRVVAFRRGGGEPDGGRLGQAGDGPDGDGQRAAEDGGVDARTDPRPQAGQRGRLRGGEAGRDHGGQAGG